MRKEKIKSAEKAVTKPGGANEKSMVIKRTRNFSTDKQSIILFMIISLTRNITVCVNCPI